MKAEDDDDNLDGWGMVPYSPTYPDNGQSSSMASGKGFSDDGFVRKVCHSL